MPAEVVERLVVYLVYSGVVDASGARSYDNGAIYNDWETVVTDVKAALDAKLQIMIEPMLMTQAEFEAQSTLPETNPLLGHGAQSRS